jgi:putative peptidoglycan lipid II flippase
MPESASSIQTTDVRRAISKAALIILALTLVDKVFALIKEMFVAANFGVGVTLDVYNLAYAVPGLLGLLLNGAVISALVPLYIDWRRDFSPQEVRDRTMTVGAVCLAGSVFIAGLCFLLASTFFPLLGYGFSADQTSLGVAMVRALILLTALEGLSAFLAALLRAWKAFAAVTAAEFPINISLIFILYTAHSPDIWLLVYGALAGAAIKALLLIFLVSRKMSLFSRFRIEKEALATFLALTAPLLGSMLIANSSLLVSQSMASQLAPGGVSTLRYAYRINDLPLQLIVLAISKAILPFVSEQASAGDVAGIRRVFGQSLISLGVIAFPAIAFVMLFSDDIVIVLLRRGAFDAIAAKNTALTLRYYTAGLFFFAYFFINGAMFCALKRASVLLYAGLFSLGLNIGLNFLFLHLMNGTEGIALASTVTSAVMTAVFLFLLRGPLGLGAMFPLAMGLVPPALAVLTAVIPCLGLIALDAAAGWPALVRLGLAAVVFVAVFVPALMFFGANAPEERQPLWPIPSLGRLLRHKG